MIHFAVLTFTSLFVIMDPVGLIPTFFAMTPRNTPQERIHIAAVASAVAFCILFICSIAGEAIFRLFSITLPAFEIAGGVVLLLVALDMLHTKRTAVKETPEERDEGTAKENIAVTPLAIPMLAGPGAITTVILLSSQAAGSWSYLSVLYLNIFLVAVLSFLILYAASVRSSFFSIIGLRITERLMGLLLCALAVQFILNGIKSAFHLG